MNTTRVESPDRFHPKSALLAAAAVEFQSSQCLIVDKAAVLRIAERAQVDSYTALRYFETDGLQELDEYLRQHDEQGADDAWAFQYDGDRFYEPAAEVPGHWDDADAPDDPTVGFDAFWGDEDQSDETAVDGRSFWGDRDNTDEPSTREYGEWALWQLDRIVVEWFAGRSLGLLQKSIGLVFLWFGALKFFPGVSPAEGLVRQTIAELFGVIGFGGPTTLIVLALALWEVLIGLGFLLDRHRRAVTWMLIAHMPGTALPLLLLPELVWTRFPHQLTLEGQYIIKNLVLLAGGFVIGATVRGGSLISSEYVEVDDDAESDSMDRSAGHIGV